MALEDQIAKYEIQVQRTGDGAKVAAAEIAAVDKAVQVVNVTSTRTANSFKELDSATKASSIAFKELRIVGTLIGSQTFPQITQTALLATESIKGMNNVAKATGATFGAVASVVTISMASLAAVIYSATAAWDAYKAKQEEALSASRLKEQQDMLRARVLEQMEILKEAGKMSADQVQSLLEKMDKDLMGVISKVREIAGTKEQLEAVQKLDELRTKLTSDSLEGLAKERFDAQQNFIERRKRILELARLAGPKLSKDSLAELLGDNENALGADSARIERSRGAKEMAKLEDDLKITAIQSSENRLAQAQREFSARTALYQQLAVEGKASEEELLKKQREATISLLEAQKAAGEGWRHLGQEATQSFAGGLSSALVAFVSRTKSAQQAFTEFASSFLQQTATMILQLTILNAIKSAGMFPFLGAANGIGPIMAANGFAGMVSSPVYMPKFNVVAGEAGAEMLTVLARPRFMNLGGVSAVVGQAGSKTLAVTNASSLAGGAGGRVVVEIQHSEESKARIIEQSVASAEVRITQRAKQNGPLREAIKTAAR